VSDDKILPFPQSGEGEVNPNGPDLIDSPPHYTKGSVEVIEIIEHVVSTYPRPDIGYNIGAALKYLCRAPLKHETPICDLSKARWHIDRAIKLAGAE